MSDKIYLSPPHMGERERELLIQAFDSNWIAPLGPHVDSFEAEFAEATGAKYAAALSSGTAALHLALIDAGVTSGDEVMVSSFTFAASVNPVLYQGATPIFVDSDLTSWNMDPNLVREELERRAQLGRLPKALVLVHLYGGAADFDPIQEACAQYEVALVEDAAEALGARYKGRQVGGDARYGVFSFNGNKVITTSGGGMLVSDDESVIARARHRATQARDEAAHYQHSEIGYNYRLSNLLAAVGRGQLACLSDRVRARRENCDFYQAAFADTPGISFMPEPDFCESSRWLSCLQVDSEQFGADREALRKQLAADSIEARPLWKPMHMQPIFSDYPCVGGEVAEQLFEHGICLPSGSNLTDADRDRVVSQALATPRKLPR